MIRSFTLTSKWLLHNGKGDSRRSSVTKTGALPFTPMEWRQSLLRTPSMDFRNLDRTQERALVAQMKQLRDDNPEVTFEFGRSGCIAAIDDKFAAVVAGIDANGNLFAGSPTGDKRFLTLGINYWRTYEKLAG
jgi:hypothetical protein